MLRRRDPNRPRAEIDELFEDLWQVPRFAGFRPGWRPQIDCFRSGDPPSMTVIVDLAGIDPREVEITATGRTLVIAGERRRPSAEGRVYERIEIDYGPFRRELLLGEDVDTRAGEATYSHGLLTITFPIAQRRPTPTKVPIEVRRT